MSTVVAAGCGDDSDGNDDVENQEPAASGVQEQDDVNAFCVEMTRLSGDRPEEYVGSPEHIEDIDALQAVAPGEVRSEVDTYRDFLASGAVDPDDPDTKLTEDWPPEVQGAISQIMSFDEAHC